ncbi:hypothetical protein HHL27_09115 [Novosphingobium sp. TW-4]|uniref:Uncharacterized protein n=2 Tax=Novosphingobium olei TaxID=2728851 RepID=A0A7Y0BPZ8_9SPHN|nr:hypothetical protein [Novosphingobium olei]
MTNEELAALDAAATQGEWAIGAHYTATGPDERCHGLVEVDDFPIGIIDEEGATAERLSPNLEFIVSLVNLYRAGKLVLVPSVEEVADAIEARMGPVFGSPEYLADPVKLARAEKRRRDGAMTYATAVLAIMGAKT